MDQILKPGQKVRTSSSRGDCVVEKLLGSGGQGEVYQAQLDGKPVALKWYYPTSATADQQKALEALIKIGAPSDRFLWPMQLANAFFDPDTGEILICDNDNVAIDNQSRSAVYGTPRFMAPEIVRGDAVPGTQTDLFSLAVLLFYMFVMHHPLEGKRELAIKCLDLPAMKKLYGTEPLFIFDPSDNSNAPDPQYQRNALAFWTVYPRFLRDLFTKAFTDG